MPLKNDDDAQQIGSSKTLKNNVIPYFGKNLSFEDSLKITEAFGLHNRSILIHKISFNILYLLHKKMIQIHLPSLIAVKLVIKKYKDNYYILKRSLFLVLSELDFILENYMHFYKPVFLEISQTVFKPQFFAHISKPNTKCTIEMLLEAFPYFGDFIGYKIEEFFSKSIFLMIQESKKICSAYKRHKGMYYKISNQSLMEFGAQNLKDLIVKEDEIEEPCVDALYKRKMTKEELESLYGSSIELQSLILLYSGDYSTISDLALKLYKANSSLFVASIPESIEILFLFGILSFKSDIFCKLMIASKQPKLPLRFLNILLKTLPVSTKKEVIRSEAVYLKNTFGFNDPDIISIYFVLKLFKDQSHSDLSKIIFLNILRYLEKKCDSVMLKNTDFDEEIIILSKIVDLGFFDNITLNYLKNILFELLGSKKYQNESLSIIYKYISQNSNCKIFIDAFILHFNKNFFDFGLDIKKKIFAIFSKSANFNCFTLMDSIMTGMDSSFFMSALSEEILKINSLRKMSFLMLSQPANKFAPRSDTFIALINNNILQRVEVKTEIYKLATIMIYKIDHFHLQTLFPILLEDFLTTILSKDTKIILDLLRFIDLSV